MINLAIFEQSVLCKKEFGLSAFQAEAAPNPRPSPAANCVPALLCLRLRARECQRPPATTGTSSPPTSGTRCRKWSVLPTLGASAAGHPPTSNGSSLGSPTHFLNFKVWPLTQFFFYLAFCKKIFICLQPQ